MASETLPPLEPGRVYRSGELRRWSASPARLVQRLVRDGRLRRAARGLYYVPEESRFGKVPARDEALLRAFLGGERFVITGPPCWNALGLGATAMFSATLAYNVKRSGEFALDGRRFILRREPFPEEPTAEWFVVDLLQHHGMAGASLSELEQRLTETLRSGRWKRGRLREMAALFGNKKTQAVVERSIRASTLMPRAAPPKDSDF